MMRPVAIGRPSTAAAASSSSSSRPTATRHYTPVPLAEDKEPVDPHKYVLPSPGFLVMIFTLPVVLLVLIWTGTLSGTEAKRKEHKHSPKFARADFLEFAPSKAEEEACKQPLPSTGASSEDQPEPEVGTPTPGQRVRMPSYGGLEYQLFLPANWTEKGTDRYPVVVFLHGAGDGKFSVMNSQSLPRLLVKDQSTSFDPRRCWCLDAEYAAVTAKKEAPAGEPAPFVDEDVDLRSPLADCSFAQRFPGIVIMPQGWLPDARTGWTEDLLEKVEALTRHVLETFRGDPGRVTLTGQSAGGIGAWAFAAQRPKLWSSLVAVCMPVPNSVAAKVEGLPVWVVGWTGDGVAGNDDLVEALKKRKSGLTRYTRYTKAPGPPDPLYRDMANHASYDLIYRDPRLWRWAFGMASPTAAAEWHMA